MMDLATIRHLSRQAARRSLAEGTLPVVIEQEDILDGAHHTMLRSVPFIGSRRPRGWKLVEEHFVDSSGFGAPGEPALTFDQFVRVVAGQPGFGWALTECGQFQVCVGQFKPAKVKP